MSDETEIADEFDPETGVGRGTGAAAANMANLMARLGGPLLRASGPVTITPPERRYGRYVRTDGPGGSITWTWVPF